MQAVRAMHAFDGARFLRDGATVLHEDGLIVGVLPGRADLPDRVEVTDHDGTLLPGLVDCHSHLVADASFDGLERAGRMTDEELDAVIADSLRAQVAAGVTTVRDLGDRNYRTLDFRGRRGLPRVVAAGPPLTTVGGHCHFLGGVVDDIAAAVDEHVQRGVDVVKVMASGGFATEGSDQLGAQFSVAELRAVVDRAHDAGLPVVAHAHSLVGIRNALAAGVDGIEHFSCLTEDGIAVDDDLLDEVARRGTRVCLTMGSDRSMHVQLTVLPPALTRLMATLGVATFDELYRLGTSQYARFRDHGVTVVSGVDSGMGPFKAHGNVWRTVGEMVEGGYPVAEALAAATSVAAEACGLGGVTGRLAAGYAADVLVVDGDLATDPALLGRPREVVVRGEPVNRGPAPS